MHKEIVICLLCGKQLSVASGVVQLCKTVSTVDGSIVAASLNTLLRFHRAARVSPMAENSWQVNG